MSRLLALVVVAAPLASCVTVHPVPLGSPEGRAEVNERAAGRVAVVRVTGERPREVRGLRLGPDSTTWVDRRTGRAHAAPTAAVSSVAVKRGGAARRLLTGAAVGAAAGGLLGTLLGAADGDGWFSFDPAPAEALGALGGAYYGGAVGVLVAPRDVYRPAPPEAAAHRPCPGPPLACAAPAGGGAGAAD